MEKVQVMSSLDVEHLKSWVGRLETVVETLGASPINLLSDTLDNAAPDLKAGDELPAGGHWFYFLPRARMSAVGADGHPARGGFLPPVPLPRRMWAASRIEFHSPLRIGEAVRRISEISDVTVKAGKSGTLVFVQVKHSFTNGDGLACVTEVQDLVYRADPQPGAPSAAPVTAPTQSEWRRDMSADPVLLFRFSALTFNGHRIHYDRPYATGVEGYPGLVVHGPLLATLLLNLLCVQRPGAALQSFEFRALRPVFDGMPFAVCGQPQGDGKQIRLWIQDDAGAMCMDASAVFA